MTTPSPQVTTSSATPSSSTTSGRSPPGPSSASSPLPWPVEPFGAVAEVREASGTEDQLIEALDGADICAPGWRR